MKTGRHLKVTLTPQAFCEQILAERYLATGEHTIDDVRQRVARALASVEPSRDRQHHQHRFLQAMRAGFIPGGRIQAAAGLDTNATLVNCFVQPVQPTGDENSWPEGIRQALTTMAAGGGVGYDLSDLRPRSTRQPTGHGPAPPSPVEFLEMMEQRVHRPEQQPGRRAAQMAVLRIDHPDIVDFIRRKLRGGLTHFNLSVAITDAFMEAVHRDEVWTLTESHSHASFLQPLQRSPGASLQARQLMKYLQEASFACGEPGIIFIDTVNRDDSLSQHNRLRAANPCGEQFLPDYGACNLGSMNLTQFVRAPFTPAAQFDLNRFASMVAIAVRALDNVIELARWPLPQQAQLALCQRRIGLGFTGLGDALFMLGLRYDSTAGRILAARITRCLRDSACAASIRLAVERGAFPEFDRTNYLTGHRTASRLPAHLRQRIQKFGIRNSHRLSIAPTGSISIAFADNVSPGIEPIFGPQVWHLGRLTDRGQVPFVADHAYRLFRARFGSKAPLPTSFVTAVQISPLAQLRMLASVMPFVDAGVSKTVLIPPDYPRTKFDQLFRRAWLSGIKAFTCYRVNPDISPAISTSSPTKLQSNL